VQYSEIGARVFSHKNRSNDKERNDKEGPRGECATESACIPFFQFQTDSLFILYIEQQFVHAMYCAKEIIYDICNHTLNPEG